MAKRKAKLRKVLKRLEKEKETDETKGLNSLAKSIKNNLSSSFDRELTPLQVYILCLSVREYIKECNSSRTRYPELQKNIFAGDTAHRLQTFTFL